LTDERMDRMIGVLLRAGVLIAAATVLTGGIWHLAQSGGAMRTYHIFRGEPVEVRTVKGVLHGIAQGHSLDLIQLGLFFLIATPIARVILCVAAFAAQRDRTYVVITMIVLTVLLTSVIGLHI
jgi:uncharacterized membrane protein